MGLKKKKKKQNIMALLRTKNTVTVLLFFVSFVKGTKIFQLSGLFPIPENRLDNFWV